MTKHLLITGAGVDRTPGIDFPLAATLLPEIAAYLEGEGKAVDLKLRTMLPNLRFTFASTVARAVDVITTRDADSQRKMVDRVKEAIKDLPAEREHVKKHGDLIIRLFNKLVVIAEAGELDDETRDLIKEVFPKDADEIMDSDSILDIHKLSLSDTFKTVLKRTLRMGLQADRNEVAAALGADMLNIENLLVEKFLGFYNEDLPNIKNYLYISWVLWAYLVHKQKLVMESFANNDLPFYSKLPADCHGITLNYTSFLERKLGRERVIYFHGGLAEYVSMATRELVSIDDDMLTLDPSAFLESQKGNFKLDSQDGSQLRHVIPALVPPLKLKPILSHRYIEAWHRASTWVHSAEHIVVVGYSFNNADEHFNDILRQSLNGKTITIVGPYALGEYSLQRMEHVFHVPQGNWVDRRIQNLPAKAANHIQLVQAYANQIDIGKLFENH
jgi:hypothetical protein